MLDIARLFQAFVAPAIFVSAAALLLLSLNVRLMGIVSRLRDFQHRRHHSTEAGHTQEAEAFTIQIRSIDARAELVRKAMLLVLICLVGTILSCLLLGLALYYQWARIVAVIVFVVSILSMLAGTCYYTAEIRIALSSVREEAKYYHLMDLRELRERRTDWQRRSD
jgi:drug/metabolite transporter (DMT)-like permease